MSKELLELEGELKRYGTPKLSFCFIPKTCVGSNLRSLLSKDDWNKLRKEEYLRTSYKCELCSNKRGTPLHCHEAWKFDAENLIQELSSLMVLCEYCHAAKHLDGTARNKQGPYLNEIIAHIKELNRWNRAKTFTYAKLCAVINRERSRFDWTMHVSYIYDRDVEIDWNRELSFRHPKLQKLRVQLRR